MIYKCHKICFCTTRWTLLLSVCPWEIYHCNSVDEHGPVDVDQNCQFSYFTEVDQRKKNPFDLAEASQFGLLEDWKVSLHSALKAAGRTLWDLSLFLTHFLSSMTNFRVGPNFDFVRCHLPCCSVRGERGPIIRSQLLSDSQMNFWHVRNFGRLTQALAQLKQSSDSIHQRQRLFPHCACVKWQTASECHGDTQVHNKGKKGAPQKSEHS